MEAHEAELLKDHQTPNAEGMMRAGKEAQRITKKRREKKHYGCKSDPR